MLGRSSLRVLRQPFPASRHLLAPSSHPRGASIKDTKATTIPQAESKAHDILVHQRKNRPLAPHLSIYQPQLTWYLSALNRVTGVGLSALFYLYFLEYAAAPLTGMLPSSTSVAAAFSSMPLIAKGLTKFALITPFMFHNFNGIRHLMWDQAKGLDLKNVYRTGYGVLAVSMLASLYYVL